MATDPKALAEKIESQVWSGEPPNLFVVLTAHEWNTVCAALRAALPAEPSRDAQEGERG